MKLRQNRRVFIPVIIVSTLFLLLAAYSFYKMSQHPPGPHGAPPDGMPHPKDKKGFDFTIFGNLAIALGAVSYWWLLFKKKMGSSSKRLQKWGKRIYRMHTYTGWTTLILVVVHGSYYLFAKPDEPKIFTGIAAFVVMLALAIYGWLYRKVKNKLMRTSHFILSNIWLVALLLHAGGFFYFVAAVTLALWAATAYIDKSGNQISPSHTPE